MSFLSFLTFTSANCDSEGVYEAGKNGVLVVFVHDLLVGGRFPTHTKADMSAEIYALKQTAFLPPMCI